MVTWIWELTTGNYDLSLSFFSNTNGQKKNRLKYLKL